MHRTLRHYQLVFLAFVSVLLVVLTFRATGIAVALDHNLPRATALSPSDPRVRLAFALSQFQQQQGIVTPTSLRSALAAAPNAPLAAEPLLLAGAAATDRGDPGRAEAMLIEARRRDPRSPLVRAYLLDLYARTGRVAQAATELAALIRLVPEGASELFVPQLAFLAHIPAARSEFAQSLSAHPDIRRILLVHLAKSGADPDLVTELAARTKGAPSGEEDEPWQIPLLDRLLNSGEIERAYGLSLRFSGANPRILQPAVYDGSFKQVDRPGPFGWRLSQRGGGVAERGSMPGLQVHYHGRTTVDLARQLLVLAPGRYWLESEVSGNEAVSRSALSWRINCLEGGSELVNVPLAEVTIGTRTVGAGFTVPAGCRGQWLALGGRPADLSRAEAVRISEISIRPLS